jgi:hypothetical protein
MTGRQGGTREIMGDNEGDNEYNSETRKTGFGECHLHVTMYGTNSIPFYVTSSKWYVRKTPVVLEVLPLDLSLLSPKYTGLLNKLWCPISLSDPSYNIFGVLNWDLEQCFHFIVTSSASLACWEGCPCQAPLDSIDPRRGNLSPSELGR